MKSVIDKIKCGKRLFNGNVPVWMVAVLFAREIPRTSSNSSVINHEFHQNCKMIKTDFVVHNEQTFIEYW